MTGLEETFYILGIIVMSLGFIILVLIAVSVLVIRRKINKIHDTIEQKVTEITSLAERGGELSALASSHIFKQAKKAFKQAKK